MDKLSRRDALKLAGVAALLPLMPLSAVETYAAKVGTPAAKPTIGAVPGIVCRVRFAGDVYSREGKYWGREQLLSFPLSRQTYERGTDAIIDLSADKFSKTLDLTRRLSLTPSSPVVRDVRLMIEPFYTNAMESVKQWEGKTFLPLSDATNGRFLRDSRVVAALKPLCRTDMLRNGRCPVCGAVVWEDTQTCPACHVKIALRVIAA